MIRIMITCRTESKVYLEAKRRTEMSDIMSVVVVDSKRGSRSS